MWEISELVDDWGDLKTGKTIHPELIDEDEDSVKNYFAVINCIDFLMWEDLVEPLVYLEHRFKYMKGNIELIKGDVRISELAKPRACHEVATKLFEDNPDRYEYYLGLATTDGSVTDEWVVHSFLVEISTGIIIEPTPLKRKKYYGRKMSLEDIKNLDKEILNHRLALALKAIEDNSGIQRQRELSLKHLQR